MAVIIEKLGIRSTLGPEGSKLDVPFIVRGAVSRALAHAAVQSQLTVFYVEFGVTLTFQNYDLTEIGDGVWEAVAHYSRKQPTGSDQSQGGQSESQSSVVSFDTQGGTFNRRQYIGSPVYTTANAPDFEGAINVNNDTVEGVDIEGPGFSWVETIYVPRALVTQTYINKLINLSQKTNAAEWTSPGLQVTFAAEDARFRYAQGSIKDRDTWEISYHFHAELQTTVTIGQFANIPKSGQHYLWVRYQEAVSNNALVRRPAAVYIGRVYKTGDFNDLNP